jgi:hypothetical protein
MKQKQKNRNNKKTKPSVKYEKQNKITKNNKKKE